MLIYAILNKINGKLYIGQTIRSLRERWVEHNQPSSRCLLIKQAINKYGRENFLVTVIKNCSSQEELNNEEVNFIKSLNTLTPNGYNLNSGGNRAIPSAETRAKLAMAKLGKPGNRLGQTKTHCKHGHVFTAENTYVNPKNHRRSCRFCHKLKQRNLYAKGASFEEH